MDDIYKNVEKYNPNRKRKISIIFDDMTVDIISNKKLNPTATESLLRRKKTFFLVLLHSLILLFQKILG